MKLVTSVYAVLFVIAAASIEQQIHGTVEGTSHKIHETVNDLKNQTSHKIHDTVQDISHKTKDVSKQVKEKSDSILSDIKSYISSVVNDIISFIKFLFGDNTPGQPAVPDSSAGIPQPFTSSRTGYKTFYLCLLGLIAYQATRFVKSPVPSSEKGYYQNIDLAENFL
jgi:hypothetical protein